MRQERGRSTMPSSGACATGYIEDFSFGRPECARIYTRDAGCGKVFLVCHLTPFFGHRRLMTITTADVRAFTARRQAAGASNATINRDLILLKRMCVLAMQAGKLTVRPYIPLLKENNVRKGFFEPEQFTSVRNHLPVHMRGIVDFAFITGWRTPSEILPLEWRQVDLKTGEVRLDPGTTKNDDGRDLRIREVQWPTRPRDGTRRGRGSVAVDRARRHSDR
jgi:integrase